jgi:hypothetical protein
MKAIFAAGRFASHKERDAIHLQAEISSADRLHGGWVVVTSCGHASAYLFQNFFTFPFWRCRQSGGAAFNVTALSREHYSVQTPLKSSAEPEQFSSDLPSQIFYTRFLSAESIGSSPFLGSEGSLSTL